MSTGTRSLLDHPWIPVRWAAGPSPERPPLVGLRTVLERSQEITGLAVSDPPAHSALLRILYALTARVTGLDEAGEDWSRRRSQIVQAGALRQGGIDGYFDAYGGRFFAYDDGACGRPWMQDPRLAEQCDPTNTAGVNKLIVTRPAGNNHSWFRHGKDTAPDLPTLSEALLHLLVWHYYGPSGRCSSREVNGVKSASMTAGPLRTALSYHPEGDTLFQTLLAGLVRPSVTVRREEDRCPWEWDELPDPDAAAPKPTGPCSKLTACSQHALLLVPGGHDGDQVQDAYITWGYRTGRLRPADDYLIWQTSQQGNSYPRPADSRRALWRDLDALLLRHAPGSAQPKQPHVFEWAADVSEDLRVRALGFEQEGQAKDTQFVDGSTPPVLGYVEELSLRTAPAVGQLRQLGELYGRRLDIAVKRAWAAYVRDAKADGGAWAARAAARYWPQAETEFWTRFTLLDRTGQALDVGLDPVATRKAFRTLAEEAYDLVTATVTGTLRGAKAVSEARTVLYGGRGTKTP